MAPTLTPITPQSGNFPQGRLNPSPGIRPSQPLTPPMRENKGQKGRQSTPEQAAPKPGGQRKSEPNQSFEMLDIPAEFQQGPMSDPVAVATVERKPPEEQVNSVFTIKYLLIMWYAIIHV